MADLVRHGVSRSERLWYTPVTRSVPFRKSTMAVVKLMTSPSYSDYGADLRLSLNNLLLRFHVAGILRQDTSGRINGYYAESLEHRAKSAS